MNEKAKAPAIRFKGFREEWEERKLGDLYAPLSERNADLLPYSKTLSVATMSYKTDGNGASDSSLSNYKRLRIGDIAFEGHTSKEFRYGRFVLNDVGDGIMSPRFSALRPFANMSVNFWKYYIHYEPIMRKVLVNSTKAGTMMNELVIDEFLRNSVLVPSETEQERIGTYFRALDRLITLQQRKCEKLAGVKKSMLQKMFPSPSASLSGGHGRQGSQAENGPAQPQIRFKGFTDAWQERKLGEICSYEASNLTAQDNISTGQYDLYDANALIGKTDKNAIRQEYISIIKDGAGVGRIRKLPQNTAILGTMGAIKPENCNYNFLYTLLEKADLGHSFSGSTIPHIYFKDYGENQYLIPQTEEQQKIGSYFSTLDRLIALHQRRLEKLRNLKKACLKKLFV